VISAAENSNKFQKTRFWDKKSVEDVGTLGPTAQATLVSTKNRSFSYPKSKQDDHLTTKTIILKHSEKKYNFRLYVFLQILRPRLKPSKPSLYNTKQLEYRVFLSN
jgi:hypothetical protein